MGAMVRRAARVFATALVAAALVGGCGDTAPSASNAAAEVQQEGGQVLLAFSPGAARAAGKIVSSAPNAPAVVEVIGAQGGELEIEIESDAFDGDGGKLEVSFTVPRGALTTAVPIHMAVYGQRLSDLIVGFEPDGLEFLRHATLEVELGEDRIDVPVEQILVLHIHDDGLVEFADHYGKWNSDGVFELYVDVPGFSVYSLGGGR